MTNISIRPMTGKAGAVVEGVDLGRGITAEVVGTLQAALDQHAVIVLPAQHVDPATHVVLAGSLGEIKPPPDYFPETMADQGFPQIGVISTDNGLATETNRWHADVTWMDTPPRYTVLNLVELPTVGGDTLWSNQYEVYAGLSEPVKSMLVGLTGVHHLPSHPHQWAEHPLVTANPRTGRPAVFANPVFTARIKELTETESRHVLDLLAAASSSPEVTCRHQWRVGDLAIWDNHFVNHYAASDYTGARRVQRIEVLGGHVTAFEG